MPVEIRELVIKATINQDQNKAASGAAAGASTEENEEKEAVVREAVEELLRIMEQKKER